MGKEMHRLQMGRDHQLDSGYTQPLTCIYALPQRALIMHEKKQWEQTE